MYVCMHLTKDAVYKNLTMDGYSAPYTALFRRTG